MTELDLVVTRLDDAVPGIRSVTLASADGGILPSFIAGSHLVIDAGGRTNAYSLTGDGSAPTTYSISVLRIPSEQGGNGGSTWVHDALEVGDAVRARLPRTAFAPVARAVRHLLIAGGIGVTPIVSHLRAAARWGREVRVLYAFREGAGAHLDDLRSLAPGAELITGGPDAFLERLRAVLVEQPIGTHLYVCGPGPMIDAVLAAGAEAGWPASRLHHERFGLDTLDPGEPFTVGLAGSDVSLDVPAGTSLLEALEAAGMPVPSLCRQGVCGECRIGVTAGRPLHRDLFLSDEERACGDSLMPCVSRADGPTLEVAL